MSRILKALGVLLLIFLLVSCSDKKDQVITFNGDSTITVSLTQQYI